MRPKSIAPGEESVNTKGKYPPVWRLYFSTTLLTATSPSASFLPRTQTVPVNHPTFSECSYLDQGFNHLHKLITVLDAVPLEGSPEAAK